MSEDTLTLDYWAGSGWADAAATCTPVSAYDRHPEENRLALPVCHLTEFAMFSAGGYEIYLPLIAR